MENGLGQPDPLTIAFAEGSDGSVQPVPQPDRLHSVGQTLFYLIFWDSAKIRDHLKIGLDTEFRIKRRIFRKITDHLLCFAHVFQYIQAAHPGRTRCGMEITGQDLHQRGLPGPVGSEKPYDLSGPD